MVPWYDRAAMFYDWVRYGEDLTPDYPREVVQKVLDVGADSLAFCVTVGGYALWNSRVEPKAPFIGKMDLIGTLSRLCKENGIHFVPWWLGTALGAERILRRHPSWQLVGPLREDGTQVRHNYICYNSPYRELIYEEVHEVLENYEVDGIYFDQLPGSCYCSWCRAKFKQRYGEPMPVVPDEFFVYNTAAGLPPRLREFRDDAVRGFCAGIRNIIDEVRPGTCYAQNWIRNQQAYLGVGTVDVLLPEFYQREDLIPLGLRHRLTRTYFDHGAIWGNVRHAVRHDARRHPSCGTRVLMFDCVANLASPVMLDLTAMDFDPTGKEELAETFSDIRAVQEIRSQSEPVRYAALLHSRKTHELFPGRFDEGFEGLYRLLFEHHVPFEIVNEAGVQRGELADYKVLIMPDVVSLADDTVAAVCGAAAQGLGLVATHMTGMMDGPGRDRRSPALADVFGVSVNDVVAWEARKPEVCDPLLQLPDMETEKFHHYATVTPDHPLAAGMAAESLLHFHGGYVVFRPGEDCQVLGRIHGTDQPRLHGRPYNRPGIYPGRPRWPLAVTRQHGPARVAYFAPQADATWRRSDSPELECLMLRAVLWAGGPPPIETPDCPAPVEVRLFRNAEKKLFQILLVNLATNPLVRAPGGWGVIRYVTPQKGLVLKLRVEGDVRAVSSLKCPAVQHKVQDGVVTIELPILDLYDSIMVQCK
ncbi:MAG: beta-galactosidase trimerization domain-containing protein [Candidatus Brocadiae bacterium]|nr:beta-galactosidase trimerization domain-containing protein [Candidatus Brocadiia bacterium]